MSPTYAAQQAQTDTKLRGEASVQVESSADSIQVQFFSSFSSRSWTPFIYQDTCFVELLAGRGKAIVDGVAVDLHPNRVLEVHAGRVLQLVPKSRQWQLVRKLTQPTRPLGRARPDSPPSTEVLARVRRYLRANCLRSVGLRDLEKKFGISRFHLVRSFGRVFGITPGAYLRTLKLEHARKLLEINPDIADVAYASGFCDQSHLHRRFKDVFEVTPGAFSEAILRSSDGLVSQSQALPTHNYDRSCASWVGQRSRAAGLDSSWRLGQSTNAGRGG